MPRLPSTATTFQDLPPCGAAAQHPAALDVVDKQWVHQFATRTAVVRVAALHRKALKWRRKASRSASERKSAQTSPDAEAGSASGSDVATDSESGMRSELGSECGIEVRQRSPSVVVRHANDDTSGKRERHIRKGMTLLDQRATHLGLRQVTICDDGNCQFRALSHQLWGTQAHHRLLRKLAVAHIMRQREEYEIFFESPREFEKYAIEMEHNRTWGDELTLKALCDAVRVCIHVITSTEGSCYVRYEPAQPRDPPLDGILAYISPIHYNSILHESDPEPQPDPSPAPSKQQSRCCSVS